MGGHEPVHHGNSAASNAAVIAINTAAGVDSTAGIVIQTLVAERER